MRIVLATESFYPATDSTTTTLKATADRLIDRGHTVRIVAPGPGLGSYRGCTVVRVRPLEPTGAQVRAALEEFAPDVAQVHSPRLVGRKVLKHASRSGVRTVVVEQSPVGTSAGPGLEQWRTKVAARASTLLVTSPWVCEQMAEAGIDASLWEPGVDPDAFTPALRDQWLHAAWSKAGSRPRPRVVVGYVGGLHRTCGVRRLAELAAVPGIRLVVVGAGGEREWLARRLPGTRFTGPLATGDLTVAMATLDLLVHPGTHETDCHPLREAAAAGVPVVAPRAGGAQHVVAHLLTGLLYDPAAPGELARAVRSVAADGRRGLLGAAAREAASRRTWADAVDELVARHYPARRPAPAA